MLRIESLSKRRRDFLAMLMGSTLTTVLAQSCKAQSTPRAETQKIVVGYKPVGGDENGIRHEKRQINGQTVEYKVIELHFFTKESDPNKSKIVGRLLIEKPKNNEGIGYFTLTREMSKILKNSGQCLPFISFPREKGTTIPPTDRSKMYTKTCLPELSEAANSKGEVTHTFLIPQGIDGIQIELDGQGFIKIISLLDDSEVRK